ncbi:hypothetical protein Airi02_090520 [Actinoallomurus iriomotensis]|uniref:PhoD-like phosphatase metallophosphatase domain-containing protein n=1 Tax=Actinoallomurus iriomotensis TaxID=478107 RepID=A0A9W6SCL3_9ACTN|nr:alkaline phosphatase D family protein [Actinoallomurus iriomotensis]GLY91123.1 hypothetical protein Airi02_090520 [Actinoallomurus iriomotensis]
MLSARARQTFFEYVPISQRTHDDRRIYRKIPYGPLLDVFVLDMRTYRDANGSDDQTTDGQGIMGAAQASWLKRALAESCATWKVIAADMPLSLVDPDADRIEAVSPGNNGAPLGRELQIADVLSSIKKNRVRNVVWITTDVHYTAAHYYDPAKAAFQDFDPFCQFFGEIAINGESGVLTTNMRDCTGKALWSVILSP